jgi:hypothetical protein
MPRPGKLLVFSFCFCTELNLWLENFPHFCSFLLRGNADEGLFFRNSGHFIHDAYFAMYCEQALLFHWLHKPTETSLGPHVKKCLQAHARSSQLSATVSVKKPAHADFAFSQARGYDNMTLLYTAKQTRAQDWGSARCTSSCYSVRLDRKMT